MHRVCVYHINQDHVARPAALCGEIIATMCYECMHFQIDVLAGDGNKAAYLCTPKRPGCPTYESEPFTVLDRQNGQHSKSVKIEALRHFPSGKGQTLHHLFIQ